MRRFISLAATFGAVIAAMGLHAGRLDASAPVPPQCAGMAFTKTIFVSEYRDIIKDTGVLLVYGRPHQPNYIETPRATQACIVGGSMKDVLIGGPGNDVLLGEGNFLSSLLVTWDEDNDNLSLGLLRAEEDHLIGHGGQNACFDSGSFIAVECERIVTP